jgi:shikimate dehydrogenase
MRLFGLIGFPLGHSFSKGYFTEKFAREGIADARYELFPLEKIDDFKSLLARERELCGINVTIPYKEKVLPFLDDLDDTARQIGAANCIRIGPDRKLTGFNTDTIAFEASLRNLEEGRWAKPGQKALILGTGGAAKGVAYALSKIGIIFSYVSRTPDRPEVLSYGDLKALSDVQLIVNTTPLGMAPNTESCPDLPFDLLNEQHLVYDLVYNPLETVLLRCALTQGCTIKNGLEMLYLQAEAGWDIWNG